MQQAWKFANKEPGYGDTEPVFLGLSCVLWGPENVKHIMTNMFDDPVIQFAIYSNLMENGSFCDPNTISSSLARVKFAMRISTLFWLIDMYNTQDKSLSW